MPEENDRKLFDRCLPTLTVVNCDQKTTRQGADDDDGNSDNAKGLNDGQRQGEQSLDG